MGSSLFNISESIVRVRRSDEHTTEGSGSGGRSASGDCDTTLQSTDSKTYDMTTLSATTSRLPSSSDAFTTPEAPSDALTNHPEVVLLITLGATIFLLILVVIIIWFFMKKMNSRSKERRNHPDATDEEVVKVKDLKGKDGNVDVEYHSVKPANYYTKVSKEPKSTSKGAESKSNATSAGQYEEIEKKMSQDQPKSMTSSNHGDNQGYEETSQHKTPFYHTLEPDNDDSNGAVTSHQNVGYDKLDRGRAPDNVAAANNEGYAKLDHTPRGKSAYDQLNRESPIAKSSQDDEIATNEYSQLDIQISSASASYDKLNHEGKKMEN